MSSPYVFEMQSMNILIRSTSNLKVLIQEYKINLELKQIPFKRSTENNYKPLVQSHKKEAF